MYIITLVYSTTEQINTRNRSEFVFINKKEADEHFENLVQQMEDRQSMEEVQPNWHVEYIERNLVQFTRGHRYED